MTIKLIRDFEKNFGRKKKNQEMLDAGAYLNFFFVSREKTFNNWAPRPLSKKVIAEKVELSKLKKGSS